MHHYQIRLGCGLCERAMMIDVVSWGTPHQSVQSIACIECVEKAGIPLLPEGAVEKVNITKPGAVSPTDMEETFQRFREAQRASKSE